MVDRARHVGEQLWVAVRVAGDERADGGVLGIGGHRSEQRVALEVFGVGVAVERIEVVPCPETVDADRVGGAPRVAHGLHGGCLRVELYADFHAANLV